MQPLQPHIEVLREIKLQPCDTADTALLQMHHVETSQQVQN